MKLNLIGILCLAAFIVLAAVVLNKINSPAEASPLIYGVARNVQPPAAAFSIDNTHSLIVAVNGKVMTLSLMDIRAFQERGTDVYLVDEAYLIR